MTFAKVLIPLISCILIMTTCQTISPEDSTTTTSETETTPPTLQKSDSFYTTCDFDLDNVEDLLPLLPDICTEIYNNRAESDLYELYLEESQNFAKFYKKLHDYELRDEPNGDKEELTRYPFEAKLRNETYSQVDWAQCATMANSSATDYLNCLKAKRLEMAELIPSVEEK